MNSSRHGSQFSANKRLQTQFSAYVSLPYSYVAPTLRIKEVCSV